MKPAIPLKSSRIGAQDSGFSGGWCDGLVLFAAALSCERTDAAGPVVCLEEGAISFHEDDLAGRCLSMVPTQLQRTVQDDERIGWIRLGLSLSGVPRCRMSWWAGACARSCRSLSMDDEAAAMVAAVPAEDSRRAEMRVRFRSAMRPSGSRPMGVFGSGAQLCLKVGTGCAKPRMVSSSMTRGG